MNVTMIVYRVQTSRWLLTMESISGFVQLNIRRFLMSTTIMLRKARKIAPSGATAHIYLPVELVGKDVVGIVVRERMAHKDDSRLEYFVEE